MKKRIIIYIGLLFGVASCENTLEEIPKGLINESFLASEDGLKNLVLSQYYQSRLIVEDLRFLGCYPSDLMTYSVNSSDAIEISTLRVNTMPTLGAFSAPWKHLYTGINNINFGLKVIKEKSFPNVATIEGELSFLRAWYYLLTVETWGTGAHFATEPTTSVLTDGNQASIDTFYTLILSDIDRAIVTLPVTSPEKGRITIPAAKALKARILLSLAGYDEGTIAKSGIQSRAQLYAEAKALCDDVIQNSQHQLLDNFESIFDTYNQGNKEVIWAVQFSALEKYNTSELVTGGHGLHRYWVGNYNKSARTQEIVPRMYGHSIYYGREYRHAMMTRSFLKMFNQKEDHRTDATVQTVWHALWDPAAQAENAFGVPVKNGIATDTVLFKPLYDVDETTASQYAARGIAIDGLNHIYNPDGTPISAARSWHHTMKKFLDPSRTVPKDEASHKEVVILRMGDIYLMAAESAFFLGDQEKAAEYVDLLRVRARKHPDALKVSAADISLDFIMDERARELGGEMLRWFDLKRTHTLVDRVNKYNPDSKGITQIFELRPIPQSEIDKVTNREQFKQNPGYPTK